MSDQTAQTDTSSSAPAVLFREQEFEPELHRQFPVQFVTEDHDDIACAYPECDEAGDEHRIELPCNHDCSAGSFGPVGFCSTEHLRAFHGLLPLVSVLDNAPMGHQLPRTNLFLVHLHDGDHLRHTVAGHRFDECLADIAQWASDDGYFGEFGRQQQLVGPSHPSVGDLSITMEPLWGDDV